MRIPRIYQDVPLESNREIALDPTASKHLLKVLRLSEGAEVIIFDGKGKSYHGVITQAAGKIATVKLQIQLGTNIESPLQLHIGLGISKGERMDYAIQKLVETGVHCITPLITAHTVVKLDAKREQTRLQHWHGVIINACEQSGRSTLPQLQPVCELSTWLVGITAQSKLVFDANGTNQWKSTTPPPNSVATLIGPEGGLSDLEINLASQHGFQHVRLGPRILRTETAAVAISAALQTLWGDF